MNNKPKVIDLFCGCGGLSQGFIDAGYNIILGIDKWQDAIETFNFNHKNSNGIVADLLTLSPETVSKNEKIDNVDVIIGGPPCQGFSIAGKRIVDDERNQLYKSFLHYVEFFKPKAFLMENVPNIMSIGKGAIKEQIIIDFEKIGYKMSNKILLASDYGVPQNRKRAFFVGLRDGSLFDFPEPTTPDNKITSMEAISDLPEHTLKDGESYSSDSKSNYQKQIRNGNKVVFNHQITEHKNKTIEIIAMVPDGGNYKSLPKELHSTRKVNIAWTRLNSNRPSFTIDTGHNHHFHYEFNRVPTARESARLQSFHDDFIFKKGKTSQLKQIGNAVPPLLAKEIAIKLKKHL
ncbi:MAG: Modification methylase BspRI [Bacteroidota bacterium]|nr:MAG: Modification methylase BspRI [Bacteroidota bacterium]